MQYVSSRGDAVPLDFVGVALTGMASDGGLYVPESIPRLTAVELHSLEGLPYPQLAARLIAKLAGTSLCFEQIEQICVEAYSGFDDSQVAPLISMGPGLHLLELFHGPTLAFKDFALQFLGRLLEHLAQHGKPLTIIGATSGDTGSAAINAIAGRKNLQLIMLHPLGRVSSFQRRQMTTVEADNIMNIAVEGTFDDCQATVKALLSDRRLGSQLRLGAVNSINWARIAAQVPYYFHSALMLGALRTEVSFAVPTGNFGNVYSAWLAAQMGLQVRQLIVATNENDICHRAISRGDYSIRKVEATAAPSMDIQVSSNFERLLYEAVNRDGSRLTVMMHDFHDTGALDVANMLDGLSPQFVSARVAADEMASVMAWSRESHGVTLDPHTAIGVAAARKCATQMPVVALATAHPCKFPEAVEAAVGVKPEAPAAMAALSSRRELFEIMPNDLDSIRARVCAWAAR